MPREDRRQENRRDERPRRITFRLFYDHGVGLGALLTAALDVGRLPADRPWEEQAVRDLLIGRRPSAAVSVMEGPRGCAYWCGLGASAPVVVRAWRYFLQFSLFPQETAVFLPVPTPGARRWIRAERAWRRRPEGADLAAREAIRYVQFWHQAHLSVWPD
ncbi:MAG: hypothetical protein QJR01_00615 [Kyrpidia sp.]|nr:hypothetical protein [Kyrpidia sp.]